MNALPHLLGLLLFLFVVVAPYWYIRGADVFDSGPVVKAPYEAIDYDDCGRFALVVTRPSPGETVARYFKSSPEA